MPTVSRAQQKAMFAAASGHSTLGIPAKVGTEFAEADMKRAHGGKMTHKDNEEARKFKGMGEHYEGGHQHGHPGRMEKLKGHAKTSAEKSHEHRHGKHGRY